MGRDDFDQDWRTLSEDILSGVYEWRLQHPKATLTELEAAIDERLARLRTKMLQDAALATPAAAWSDAPAEERPRCPECHTPLQARGTQPRTLQTHGGRDLVLERSYGVCPTCEAGFSPLDDELALLPGRLTPRLVEELVHLATWMPFTPAAKPLARSTRVERSEPTVRRQTQAAGAAYVAVQTAEAAHILQA